jgi:hypothetical protein
MSNMSEPTWEQELLAEGALRGCRKILRELLEERFGAVPEALAVRIEQTQDLERLRRAVRQVLQIQQPAELDL